MVKLCLFNNTRFHYVGGITNRSRHLIIIMYWVHKLTFNCTTHHNVQVNVSAIASSNCKILDKEVDGCQAVRAREDVVQIEPKPGGVETHVICLWGIPARRGKIRCWMLRFNLRIPVEIKLSGYLNRPHRLWLEIDSGVMKIRNDGDIHSSSFMQNIELQY